MTKTTTALAAAVIAMTASGAARADVIAALTTSTYDNAVGHTATLPDVEACRNWALSISVSSFKAKPAYGSCSDAKTGLLVARIVCEYSGSGPWIYSCHAERTPTIAQGEAIVLGENKASGSLLYPIVGTQPDSMSLKR